jgi:hypothetical protein
MSFDPSRYFFASFGRSRENGNPESFPLLDFRFRGSDNLSPAINLRDLDASRRKL